MKASIVLQWTQITAVCLHTESQCSKPPEFKPSRGLSRLWGDVGSTAKLNCTALLPWDQNEERCDTTLQWSKDGRPLTNLTLYMQNTSSWWFLTFGFPLFIMFMLQWKRVRVKVRLGFLFLVIRSPVAGQLMVNSLLVITLRELEDFGLYSCTVRNVSSEFSLQNSSKKTWDISWADRRKWGTKNP